MFVMTYDIEHHAVVIISQRLGQVQWPTRPIGQWLEVSKWLRVSKFSKLIIKIILQLYCHLHKYITMTCPTRTKVLSVRSRK